ncbi:hypothetical protein ACE7GA_26600 (plasmid) [Roseomonas sp. CCTCC AB2023176]|uniref:hypothetical protein n=1 Tax=Roseomonas sp. CCTCC AB2023176 TaxID=3342640 RepID=UPI0035D7E4E2
MNTRSEDVAPMYDDYTIIHSRFEEHVTRDGVTAEVLIYRGEDDPGWILEIINASGLNGLGLTFPRRSGPPVM